MGALADERHTVSFVRKTEVSDPDAVEVEEFSTLGEAAAFARYLTSNVATLGLPELDGVSDADSPSCGRDRETS